MRKIYINESIKLLNSVGNKGTISLFAMIFSKVFCCKFVEKNLQVSLKSSELLTWPMINPFPPADTFWGNSSWRLLKTLWLKDKLLMMSNLSFGHNVFNFILQLSYLLWRFFRFLSLYVFKVVCCRFTVCGKGLRVIILAKEQIRKL